MVKNMDMERFNVKQLNEKEVKRTVSGYNQKQVCSCGKLTRGTGRLLPSDLAPILQYSSRPPSDFLAKILGVDTSPFLWNTRFYFTRSYQ
jgi:hypothetical protein